MVSSSPGSNALSETSEPPGSTRSADGAVPGRWSLSPRPRMERRRSKSGGMRNVYGHERDQDRHQGRSVPGLRVSPAGGSPWPAVLVFMDGIGIRPAMLAVGE